MLLAVSHHIIRNAHIAMSLILSKDAAIYYEEYGSGEPLILLPGLLGTIETHWRRFIGEFAAHFHTIAVDLRGHGKTNNPSGTLRLQTFVDDLHSLFETLQIGHARICGYSLGGYIGLLYGLQHPGRVCALIMHGTKFYWEEKTAQTAAGELNPDVIMSKSPVWGQMLQEQHSRGNGNDGWQTLLQASSEFILTMPANGITAEPASLLDFPVMVSLATNDELIPREEAEQLVSALPGATLSIVENARHAMQTVPKQQFVEQVVSFFNSIHGTKKKYN